jgi:hypothetical protein
MSKTVAVKEKISGFKPDALAKKLLSNFSNHAYIYPQGVMIRTRIEVKVLSTQKKIEVFHVYPCEIQISRTSSTDPDRVPISRIVCDEASVLLDGIKRIEYFYNNCSEHMEKRGLTCNTVTLVTLSGARHRSDDWPDLLGSIYTVQSGTEFTWDRIIESETNSGAVLEYHNKIE